MKGTARRPPLSRGVRCGGPQPLTSTRGELRHRKRYRQTSGGWRSNAEHFLPIPLHSTAGYASRSVFPKASLATAILSTERHASAGDEGRGYIVSDPN